MSLFGDLELVLFDLDGTLVRTDSVYYERFLGMALNQFGVTPNPELVKRLWFDDNRSDIIKGLGVDPDNFWDYFNKVEDGSYRANHLSLYDVEDPGFVNFLTRKRIFTGVVTGTTESNMNLEVGFFNSHNSKPNFDVFHSTNKRRISKGDLIVECLDYFVVSPDKTVYVCNSDMDIVQSRSVGVRNVLVDRREYPVVEKPDYRISGLRGLLRV